MSETFENWWNNVLKVHNYAIDPDDPLHYYDYRAAFDAGHGIPEDGQHWSSKFKHDLHPNRFVSGRELNKPDIEWWDSKYDKPAKASEVLLFDVIRQNYERRLKNR